MTATVRMATAAAALATKFSVAVVRADWAKPGAWASQGAWASHADVPSILSISSKLTSGLLGIGPCRTEGARPKPPYRPGPGSWRDLDPSAAFKLEFSQRLRLQDTELELT